MSFPHLSKALPQLATPEEIAAYLGEKPVTVQRQLRRGDLPGVKVGGRWFVHVGRLAEQLEGFNGASRGGPIRAESPMS